MVHPEAIQLVTIPHAPIVSLNLNPMCCFPTVSAFGESSSLTPATHCRFSALDDELNVQPSLSHPSPRTLLRFQGLAASQLFLPSLDCLTRWRTLNSVYLTS